MTRRIDEMVPPELAHRSEPRQLRRADDELAELTPDAVAKRHLVPSTREQGLGIQTADHADQKRESERATPRPPLLKLVASHLKDLSPRRISGPKRPALVLGLAALAAEWDDRALPLLLPEMRAEFGISLQFLTTLTSMMFIVTILLAPAMGYLADRLKRVWLLRVGSLLASAGSVITATAGAVPGLVLGRSLTGGSESVRGAAGFPLLADQYPSSARVRIFGFVAVSGTCGTLLAATVGANLAERWGWRVAVISLAVVWVLVTVGYLFVREPVRGYWDRMEMGTDEGTAQQEQAPVSWSEGWRAARSITTLRRLWYATPPLTLAGAGITIFVQLYYAQEFGLGPRERGYIVTAQGVVTLVALLFAAPAADRLLAYKPGRVMAMFGAVLLFWAGSLLVLVVSENLWLSIIVSLPLGAGIGALLPALFALISMVVPARIRGLGLQTIAPWQLVGMLALPFVGAAADSWGLRRGILVFVPILVLGAIVFISSAFGVERDIRAARSASLADEEARVAAASGRNKMIICRDVDVTYGGVQVLFNVDFDVEEGELVALLGTNGAGKSTLLRAISGVHEASNGAIFLDGQDITHVPPHENAGKGIVMVPGGHAIFPTLSVEENLRTATWMFRDDESYVTARLRDVLEFFPVLRERLNQPAGNLSGGEQQMVALGQAFLMKPRLLMIDELSLGLAPQIVEQLLGILRRIHEQGTTIIIVEQSLNVAVSIAKRAVFMEKGEIRFDGATEDLLRRPELVRAVFMGAAAAGSVASGAGPARQHVSQERDPILTVQGVDISFGGVTALTGAQLEVLPGEIVGVIGPNGAGKTTLFDVISGYLQPASGEVRLDQVDVMRLGPDARARLGLGRSFQNAVLFPAMTVRENIAVALENHLDARNPVLAALWSPRTRRSERRTARRVDSLIELLGLTAYADKFVDELSTGSRRAVDIACVMAAEPKVLLLDEPSSGLAQAESEELGPVLMRLVRDTGCGLLVIEHDLPLVASISDRLVAMELGRAVAVGPPAEVLSDPRVTASYLSASEDVIARSRADFESRLRPGATEIRTIDRERLDDQ